MKKVRNNLGIIADFLLSLLFERENFCYAKILEQHTQELSKTQGILHSKEPFLYSLPYSGYARELLWALKFKNNKPVANLLGRLLWETLPEHLIEWGQFENFINPILITIPSSKQSLRKRGFNQNHLIIESFLKQGDAGFVSYQANTIKKIKDTPRQSRIKSKQERLDNPKDSFAIADKHLNLIKNKNIILFDDILTTGATTREAVRVLKKARVRQIKIVVIAH